MSKKIMVRKKKIASRKSAKPINPRQSANHKRNDYKLTKLGRIPDEWEYEEIGDKIDLLSGFAFESESYAKEGIRLLRGSNIKRGNTDWSPEITQFWDANVGGLDRYRLKEGDLVIAMDGSLVGRSYALLTKADLPALLLQRVARIRSTKLDIGFLKEYISSLFFVGYCDSVKTVTAIPHISSTDIKKFKIAIPLLPEQQKIARILSTWDKAIEKTEQLIAQKQKLKKGFMQKLLTGKVRFKEFVKSNKMKLTKIGLIPEEWNFSVSSDAIRYFGGNAFDSADSRESGTRWLKIANVGIGKVKWDEKDFLPGNFISKYPSFVLKSGDVVLALTRPILNNQLKIAKLNKFDEPCLLNQRVAKIIAKRGHELKYLFSLLQLPYFIYMMNVAMAGTDPPNIGNRDLGKIKIPLPIFREQCKIADLLESINTEIEYLTRKRDNLRSQKKGLMQHLLTGQLRVKA